MRQDCIPIDQITIDPELQSRVATDSEAIEEYAEAIEAGRILPPVKVFRDGETYWLSDGFHRVPAHVEAGHKLINVIVVDGTREDALWDAAGANTTHGVRRTNADKRRQVEMALALRPDSSNRSIAEHCGVSHVMVADARPQVEDSSTSTHRTGKDGKSYPTARGEVEEVKDLDDAELLDDPEEHDEEAEPVDDQADALALELKEASEPYRLAVNDLLRIKRDMQAIADDEYAGGQLRPKITRIATEIDSLKSTIRQMEPVKHCEGCMGEGCDRCSQTGFWSRMTVEARPA